MDCSCSSDNSGGMGAPTVSMGGLYGGQGASAGLPPITLAGANPFGGFPVQRGVPIHSFGATQQMVEVPYS
uniref:Uncharacterized protein n=1 Tax=Caenorhabditis japonica TaxID=281687 RepID=A0A8R1INX4_CAEJA